MVKHQCYYYLESEGHKSFTKKTKGAVFLQVNREDGHLDHFDFCSFKCWNRFILERKDIKDEKPIKTMKGWLIANENGEYWLWNGFFEDMGEIYLDKELVIGDFQELEHDAYKNKEECKLKIIEVVLSDFTELKE